MKQKLFRGCIAILAVLLAFVVIGCSDSGGSGPGTDPGDGLSDVTTLNGIKIGEEGASYSSNSSSRNAVLGSIAKLFDADISASIATQAEVTLNLGTQFKGTAKIAKIASTATISEADFTITYNKDNPPKFDFENGDKLYVKMTAENGTTVMYYGYLINIGSDANLKAEGGITFAITGGNTSFNVERLGEPKASIEDLDALDLASDDLGKVQCPVVQPTGGFRVTANTSDPDATAQISTDGTTWVNNGSVIADFTGKSLYVKVLSSNEQKTQYYKILVILMRAQDIPYGTLDTVDLDTIDAKWDTVATDWLPIDRANVAEGAGWNAQDVADRSWGQAKLMWDEDGIWVYAQVWEKVVSDSPGEHTKSSVELFVNEAYSAGVVTGAVTGSASNGGQYRLGANGERSGAPSGAVAAFNALGQFAAKKYTSGMLTLAGRPDDALNSLDTGYTLMFHAPWRYPDLYKLEDGKSIGIELQINATGSDGTRVGVLNWNNANSNSYGSLADYGVAYLKLNGAPLKPLRPIIDTNPASKLVEVNSTTLPVLSVVARTVETAGQLGYQWYKASDGTADDTAISGATNASYQLTSSEVDTSAPGEFFFYVKVSNTVGGASSYINSGRAKITVIEPTGDAIPVELVNSTHSKWDATANALVVNGNVGAYQEILSLPIPATLDVTKYKQVNVIYDAYTGDGTVKAIDVTNVYNTDIFFNFIDGSGGNDTQYNASGILSDETGFVGVYISTDSIQSFNFSGGTGKLVLKDKLGTNTATTGPITKYVIKSVEFIPKPLELVNSDNPKWDATAKALVVNGNVGNYQEIVSLPIPATLDITKYARFYVIYEAYTGDGTVKATDVTEPNNTDIYFSFKDGSGTAFSAPSYGDYNASGIVKEGTTFVGIYRNTDIYQSLDFSGGQGSLTLKDKRGTNNDTSGLITKYVIKSVYFEKAE